MPYKNKEDTAEAMRRHRAKQKETREEMEEEARGSHLFQKRIGEILTDNLGFTLIPFSGLVEHMQQEYIVKEDSNHSKISVIDKATGKIIADPEVYLGLNMMIVIRTPELEGLEAPQDNEITG